MAYKVFISYACSRKDKKLRQELEKHLSNLKRQDIISSWSDGDITPGTAWRSQIIEHLNTAEIILLLVSADFMASDFCSSTELVRAIDKHHAHQAHVIPILLRPTDWKDAPFAKLKMLPTDAKAVTLWPTHDEAFKDVVQGIRQALSLISATPYPDIVDSMPSTLENTSLCIQTTKPHAENYSRQTAIQREEQMIIKNLQAARGYHGTVQVSPKYKIDASSIIECNLHQQKHRLIEGLGGHYNGMFVFTVASSDRSVLKEYVLESLVWKLKQHLKRPIDPIRPIYLSLEHLDFSSIEQGVHSLQQELEKQLSVHSFTDLLSDNQGMNQVIVIWLRDIALNRFQHIARAFSWQLKAQVTDLLREQERCLILFWANHGPSPIELLEVPTVLPAFEQFEIEHLSAWIEHEVGIQLRDQNVSEQEIKYCREKLVAKVQHFGGRLPETYEILRHSLELGGTF